MSKENPEAGDLFLYDFKAYADRKRYGIMIVVPSKYDTSKLELRWLCNSEPAKQYFHPWSNYPWSNSESIKKELSDHEFLFNLNGYTLETEILKSIGKIK